MRSALRGARAAVVFLTRVPAGGFPYSDQEWRWAAGWFPRVGAGIGVVMSGLWWLMEPLGPLPASIIVVASSMWITGGFHEDGLADTADALGGAMTRERIFEILKDSRIGSFGALALLVSVLLRITLLAQLSSVAISALILSQCIARMPPVWLMVALPYVTPDSVARSRAVARASWRQGALATLLVAIVITVLSLTGLGDPRDAAIGTGVAGLGAVFAGYRFQRRAGGVTGDFLGATEQIAECLVLMTLAYRRLAT